MSEQVFTKFKRVPDATEFAEPIPRMPPVRRWKSALIKILGAFFFVISFTFYAVMRSITGFDA